MRPTDIRVKHVRATFTYEPFRTPLRLSGGLIEGCVYALVHLTVENRRGRTAEGIGGIFLSDLWAFPTTAISHDMKEAGMKQLVSELEAVVAANTEYMDPLMMVHVIQKELPGLSARVGRSLDLPVAIPELAGLVCLSPFDAALHDAWGKAHRASVFAMYTADFLNEDLSYYFGAPWRGRYPAAYLGQKKRSCCIQHVVGIADLLTDRQAKEKEDELPADGLPVSLEAWIERDGVNWFKLKTKGVDVDWDFDFIRSVYRTAVAKLNAVGRREPVYIAIDPNEACPGPEPVVELLGKLRRDEPEVFRSLLYIEQPTSRDLARSDFNMSAISSLKPVIVDESLYDLGNLALLESMGWSGVALKTCKGHSHALLAYCWARDKGRYITLQDLTNPGYAFAQAASLFGHLSLSVEALEFNSRQYAPFSRTEEQRAYDHLFRVCEGRIVLGEARCGLY